MREILKLVDPQKTLVCYCSPVFGLVPAEISDIFPVSQVTHQLESFPKKDPVLNSKTWKKISVLFRTGDVAIEWLENELKDYSARKKSTQISISRNYKTFKKRI